MRCSATYDDFAHQANTCMCSGHKVKFNDRYYAVSIFGDEATYLHEKTVLTDIILKLTESTEITDETKHAIQRCTCLPTNNDILINSVSNGRKIETVIDVNEDLISQMQADINRILDNQPKNIKPPEKPLTCPTFTPLFDPKNKKRILVYTTFENSICISDKKLSTLPFFQNPETAVLPYYDLVEALITTMYMLDKLNLNHYRIEPDHFIVGYNTAGGYLGVKIVEFSSLHKYYRHKSKSNVVNQFSDVQIRFWNSSTINHHYTMLEHKDELELFATNLLGTKISLRFKLAQYMASKPTYGFHRLIDTAHYQTLLTLLYVTEFQDFNKITGLKRQSSLFSDQMKASDKFRVFVRLSLMVVVSWLVKTPDEISPEFFLKTLKDMLKIVVREPFTKWERVQIRTFDKCPVFLQRLLSRIHPNFVAVTGRWRNNYHAHYTDMTTKMKRTIPQSGGNSDEFYTNCIAELIVSLVDPTHKCSQWLRKVMKAVDTRYSKASEAIKQKVWRGGKKKAEKPITRARVLGRPKAP